MRCRNLSTSCLSFFSGRCLTGVFVLCLALAAPADADPIVVDPTADLLGNSGQALGPLIAVDGRLGADALRDVNQLLQFGNYDALIEKASAIIKDEPKSGLAYEVIGTAEFMLNRRASAIEALKRATDVESGQSGPWTKLGIIQMEEGDIVRAESSLRRAIEINDNDRFAHQRLGMLFEFQNDVANAIYHFERGLRGTGPDYLGVAVNLGGLYNRVNRPQRTIATLGPRVATNTPLPLAHLVLATAYLMADRYDDAYASYERAVALDADLVEARLGMAMSRREAGNAAEALDLIDDIVAEQPTWRPAHAERAQAFLALDDVAAANSAFDRFVALGGDPDYGPKRVAAYYLERENFDAARSIYAKLVAAGNADPESFAKLSELYLSGGLPDEGEQTLRDGVAGHPDNAYLKLRLGAYLAALRRYDEAVVELKAADRIAPNDQIVLRSLSLAQARAGLESEAAETAARLYNVAPRPDVAAFYASRLRANDQHSEAAAVYREVLEAEPNNALALNNLADLLADMGELAEAEQRARQANDVVEDNPQLMDTLAWVLHRRGEHKEALGILDRAIPLAPKTAVIHYHRGVVLASLGQRSDARVALSEALRLAPDAMWAADAEQRLRN
jgi:tetratricopeptide (TPR) repeat protein